ncbi:hypothetical protein SCOR_14705 [Sulfidibacter corallicola]|uniref:Uncharacterized protein n=1 Tax=Sulfidibacter corallicola TaxID=2818388 RepID=A0A8A4U6A6_SULCO|nr:hypothetical protein [Sulfidibacter corallicola]QTD54285.1 hypothetical protein J3U87_17715 [Sulfidibacter corallicola]
MSRWGEEEKKSKGIVGLIVTILVTTIFFYTFYRNYQALEFRRNFEKEAQKIIRDGMNKKAPELKKEILDASKSMGMELPIDAVDLTREIDEYGNPVIDMWIDIPVEIDLLVTTYPTSLPIAEKVTLIDF